MADGPGTRLGIYYGLVFGPFLVVHSVLRDMEPVWDHAASFPRSGSVGEPWE